MTVWTVRSYTFTLLRSKLLLSMIAIFVVIMTTLFVIAPAFANSPSERTISFSARLKSAGGSIVPDGNYNISFNLYTDSQTGTPIWSETYHDTNGTAAGEDYRVNVVNGYLNVKLGSRNNFTNNINWGGPLWLTMNIGGTAQVAVAENIDWDGEMSPRIQLTAVPYAMSAGSLDGKAAGDFVQLGQGVQTDASDETSIYINKTGSGDLIQLQHNAEDILTVDSTGDITFGANSDHSITIAEADASSDGYALTISGGDGGTGSTNGGNLVLSGGSGGEGGADGLVILTTPTFATTVNDANCYPGGVAASDNCTIAQSTVDSSAAVMVGFDAADRQATLPDPTISTPGRVFYVMAANESLPFTLLANTSDELLLQPKVALTLLWNGSDWVTANGSTPSGNLQDAYDASVGSAEIVVDDNQGKITIREDAVDSIDGALLQVQNSDASNLLSVSSRQAEDTTELVSDGDITVGGSDWVARGSATVSRYALDGHTNGDSLEVVAGVTAGNGVANILAGNPQAEKRYKVSVATKLTAGSSFDDLVIGYTPDDFVTEIECSDYSSRTVGNDWAVVTCYLETDATTVTAPRLYFEQPTLAGEARTFLIDAVSLTQAAPAPASVRVGDDGDTTLFKLDNADAAPTEGGSKALLGSMYYDTSIGKVQCYEADGWGACGDAPDTFVTISPEYTNAVMNGNDVGVISSDFCSDSLNINDGSGEQPAICGENETYNFYSWTTSQTTDQTRSIYMTYQLPENFDGFVEGSTSIMARTDSADSTASYQIYRDNASGLTSCGSLITVATGSQTLWQRGTATGGNDPAACNFEAGESLLLRINLTAKDDANAYVSNVNFVFRNNL